MRHPFLPLVLLVFAVTPGFSQRFSPPTVDPAGRVTFRLSAPNATNVHLRCEGVNATNMLRDDAGVWSVTTEPLAPDYYACAFVVDGLRVLDPGNPVLKYNLAAIDNQVHVPGPKDLPWELNDVPRGELHRHFYRSAIAGEERDFVVYTPPGYNPRSWQRYPVLYLLHGYTDDTSAWTSAGLANVILDNLIARKQATPMIVVMPLGYGILDIVRQGGGDKNPLWQTNMLIFRDILFREVMPQVEKKYRVAAKPEKSAIAGLSMGGAESLLIGLNAPDKFAWVGSFSAGGLQTNFASQFPALNKKSSERLRLLWIGCGESDRLLTLNRNFHEWLNDRQVPHQWVTSANPGRHTFRLWRRNLAVFAPLLFQDGR